MTGALLIGALVALLFAHAAYKTARERVKRVGASRIVVRWLLGRAWHGDHITNAGFRRPGTKALTRTGHASRFHHRPQWQRVAMRGGGTALVLAAVYGGLFHRALTLQAAKVAAAAAIAGLCWLTWFRLRRRRHRRTWVYPLHAALAPHLDRALPGKPEAWLQVARDRSRAVIALPASFDANSQKMTAIAAAAAARLGMESPEPVWKLAGPKPRLILEAAQPPPKAVAWAGVEAAVMDARRDELVLGLGRRGRDVSVSLAGDSPHIGLSIGSGGGKSVTALLLAAQAAYRGATVLILDFPKMVSIPALRGLPNVAYCDSAALVHAAGVWLAHELEDRAALVKANTGIDGTLSVHIPRLLVVCEETNALMNRLRHYWADVRETGDPKRSPAIDGLELCLFMGRQLHVNLVQIGQFLSARATGSGEARENLGIRILGRATVNNWKVLVPEHPYPGKTKAPGRVHVVTDAVRECQIANLAPLQARELAMSGTVTPCPDRMPGRPRVPASPRTPLHGPDVGGPNGTAPVSPGAVPDAVSLSEAVALGLLPGGLAAARKRVQRDADHPQPIGKRGLANLFDPAELAQYGKEL